jgi:hypothetical protein
VSFLRGRDSSLRFEPGLYGSVAETRAPSCSAPCPVSLPLPSLPLQVLVLRLRSSVVRMGEELSRVTAAESQQRESSRYYQRRLEELKADMEELARREAEAGRRCLELVRPGSGEATGPGHRGGAAGGEGQPEGRGSRRGGAESGCCHWLRAPGAGPSWTNGVACRGTQGPDIVPASAIPLQG